MGTCCAARSWKNAISIRPLSTRDQRHADAGEFRQLSGAPKPVFVTNVPITTGSENPLDSKRIDFVVLSADLVYPLANLPPQIGNTAHAATGDLARLLASYCSDPLVLAQIDEAQWVQINGTSVWGCGAAPSDRRVLAALIALIALAILVTSALNISSAFTNFAERLRGPQGTGRSGKLRGRRPQRAAEDRRCTEHLPGGRTQPAARKSGRVVRCKP